MQYFVPDLFFWKAAAGGMYSPCHVSAMHVAVVSRIHMKFSKWSY